MKALGVVIAGTMSQLWLRYVPGNSIQGMQIYLFRIEKEAFWSINPSTGEVTMGLRAAALKYPCSGVASARCRLGPNYGVYAD